MEITQDPRRIFKVQAMGAGVLLLTVIPNDALRVRGLGVGG